MAKDKVDGSSLPAVPVRSENLRMATYKTIAEVHKRLVTAKWRARMAGKMLYLPPNLMLHCEESIAFLAEELLKLQSLIEALPEKMVDEMRTGAKEILGKDV